MGVNKQILWVASALQFLKYFMVAEILYVVDIMSSP